jgi:hypothetical protein
MMGSSYSLELLMFDGIFLGTSLRKTFLQVSGIYKTTRYGFCNIYINLTDYRKIVGLTSITLVSSEELPEFLSSSCHRTRKFCKAFEFITRATKACVLKLHNFTIFWQIQVDKIAMKSRGISAASMWSYCLKLLTSCLLLQVLKSNPDDGDRERVPETQDTDSILT